MTELGLPPAAAHGALLATLALPVAMLLACLHRPARARMLAWLVLAPLPGLAAALLAVDAPALILDEDRLRFTLVLGRPGAILLGVAALLWAVAGTYAAAYLRRDPRAGRFAVCWLLTLTGSLGVFFAGDLFSFYLLFALVSLAAYGLVVHDGTPRAAQAGVIYLFLAVLGEICMLAGFALLAVTAAGPSLALADVLPALPGSPWLAPIAVVLLLGFGLKAGLVPLHVWLPLAHPAAPMPASAALSGPIIKSGVIGLIVFLPLGAAMPGWGGALTAIGLVTAYFGVAVGLTQANPKTVLAYSSISQMGVVATVLGMIWSAGAAGESSLPAYYAAHHVLAKSALFLGVGVVAAAAPGYRTLLLAVSLVPALGLAGLPLTGGALAKLAVEGPLARDGTVAALAALSAAGTAALMLHFLTRLAAIAGTDGGRAPAGALALPWVILVVASTAIPWLLFATVTGASAAAALAPASLWKSAWPVLLGLGLYTALRLLPLSPPHVPEGDLVVLGERAVAPAIAFGGLLERTERLLTRWPVAGLAMLLLTVALFAAFAIDG